jgi:hypothetical protein
MAVAQKTRWAAKKGQAKKAAPKRNEAFRLKLPEALSLPQSTPALRRRSPTESRRTTKLYDRRNDAVALDEIERVV